MNEQLRPRALTIATQAAEGLPRRRWSVAEIEEMVAKGILGEDERFELIGGEVVPMPPKCNRHEVVKAAPQQHWFPRVVATPINLITETTLYVSDDEFLEPDFLFWPRAIPLASVTARFALLIVEVADSSLAYDLCRKAGIYARLGLQELWVIDAKSLVTTIHRDPTSSGYVGTHKTEPSALLSPMQAPLLAVSLAALGLL